MCGEQLLLCHGSPPNCGSPPRVRGTAGLSPASRPAPRITPACAGNRLPSGTVISALQDHPRVCGEQLVAVELVIWAEGSPPRVRGTVRSQGSLSTPARITPACAGNRETELWHLPEKWDHPRVCGEQWVTAMNRTSSKGSPPRVRGTVADLYPNEIRKGITPACAGNRMRF